MGRNLLFDEINDFTKFYRKSRCDGSPSSPYRIYVLCSRTLYEEYRQWMSMGDILWNARAVLAQLFNDYNMAKYQGRLRQADNFVNLFMRRMRKRLDLHAQPRTDDGRGPLHAEDDELRAKDSKKRARNFPHRPTFGLKNNVKMSGTYWCDEFRPMLFEAMQVLDDNERAILKMRYEYTQSFANIGHVLGIHKMTAKRRHDKVISKLGKYYA